jgi:EmrB/QacA subfamily drug resistance transporter
MPGPLAIPPLETLTFNGFTSRQNARMSRDLPRDISRDNAQTVAAEVGDGLLQRRTQKAAAVQSAASAAFARGPHDNAVLPPLDPAAIHTIIAGICLAMFLSALEQTIVAPALPAIGKSLGDLGDLPWVVTAYLLATTVATPLFGKLSDIYGRRSIMLLGIGIFIVGSLACSLAPTILLLVLARGLQGIGGGGLIPIAQTIIADILSPRERPIAQSYTSIVFLSASIFGPVLGGLLTDHLHWSFIFWINLPLGAVALVMTARALRRLPRHDRPHQLDLVGGGFMVAASLALMLALAWGGTRYHWASWQIIALVAGSAVLWVLFAGRLLTAREPFIPLSILRGRVTITITCAGFFSIGTIIGVTIYTPLYCQAVLGASASVSGLALITFLAGATLGSLVTGRLLPRLKHYMRVSIIGLVVAISTLGFLAVHPAGLSLGSFALLLGVLGAAIGPMYQTTTIVMQNAVKPHQMGTATGTLNFFRLLGGAIIVAAFGAVVLGSASDHAGVMVLENLAAEHVDFVPAFRLVFIAAAMFLVIALACLLAVEERPLHGPVRVTDVAVE